MPPDLQGLSFQTGSIFTPGAPINEKDLFAGRSEQVEKIIDAVRSAGATQSFTASAESARPRCRT